MAQPCRNRARGFDFDDEEAEREEHQLDQLLQEFENEPAVVHDQVPETDDEVEEDGRELMQTHITRGDGHLYDNQTFFNGVAFKDRVLDYALRTRYNIRQYRYDKDKIGFDCLGLDGNEEPCHWQIYASILPKDKIWRVRKFIEEHTCERNGVCEMVKVPVIARPQCQAARRTALRWIESEYEYQFARLRDYAAEIVESNPGSSVKVETFQNAAGEEVFHRFISDRHHGLIRAIKIELPKMEHRKCVIHIYGNLKKKHEGKTRMKSFIWRLAWSYNEAKFQVNLDRIRNYDTGVYDDVMATSPRSWCRAFYKLGPCCEDVENNSTESFNSSINKAREKAFIPMLETIARQAMARIAVRSRISHDHKGKCTPYVEKKLAKMLVDKPHKHGARKCVVTKSVKGYYESRLNGQCHTVSLENRTCSCRKWEITGIPCKHAYGVMLKYGLDPLDYVCHWFRSGMWRRNYSDGLVPVRGCRFWPETNAPDVHVPPEKEKPGEEAAEEGQEPGNETKKKKKKKLTNAEKMRKKGVNESPTKKQRKEKQRIMHCGVCGEANHNSRHHAKDKDAPRVSNL
ncbi:unnamed protein product [Microthlaspi erraticum]|uniref:SWIM-type domain-containing protein n=1 Tax=Microthlaspi erraticum TaxID=1685480 RepID=A0A6D2JXU2_9BRAS|nr:unnamed protein product [Microthlaspi erraticum]